jgi:L-lactate dehydrogenase
MMKAAIIGGGGRVGSDAAFCCQLWGIFNQIALLDVVEDMARGEALDLRHGAAGCASQSISYQTYEEAADSDIFIITAGLRRKPDESRLELINRNVGLFRSILGELKKTGMKESAHIFVVANPVDILTYIAVEESGLHPRQVYGLGTMLDTIRFRSLLAEYFCSDPTQVNALILGEHGDSMVPIWSTATINGTPLQSMPTYDEDKVKAIFDFTKKSGAEVIRMKGGAGRAVGVAIAMVAKAIFNDSKSLLPISSIMTGHLGIKDVCFSLPSVVGVGGVEQVVEVAVSPDELEGLKKSAASLRDVLDQVITPAAA